MYVTSSIDCLCDSLVPIVSQSSVSDIVFFPDGSRIATASSDNTVRLWNIPDPTAKLTSTATSAHSASINATAWSSDGKRVVTGSHDETLRVWDVQTGKMIGSPRKG